MADLHTLVLAVLRLNLDSTAEDIAAWINLSPEQVQEIIDDLVADGLVLPTVKR